MTYSSFLSPIRSGLLICLSLLLTSSLTLAQTPGGSLASQERTITGGDLALISYIVLWVLVLAVVLVVFLRQKRLNQEMANLERKLDALAGLGDKESAP